MEKTIWLCRHGETEWNLERRKQGHKDSPLTEHGQIQAKILAYFFRNMPGKLFTSSLGRAVSTAQSIYEKNPQLGLQPDNRIKELSFGDLEGMTALEISQIYPDIIHNFRMDPFSIRFPNGESYGDLLERVRKFLDDLERSEAEEIIIVAHEDINRILLTLLLDLPLGDAIRIAHPNVIIYKVKDKIVKCFNIDGSYVSGKLLMEGDN